jgi:hypothetical protein
MDIIKSFIKRKIKIALLGEKQKGKSFRYWENLIWIQISTANKNVVDKNYFSF